MAKRAATLAQVTEATTRLLAANNGRIEFRAWKTALEEELGDVRQSVSYAVAHKTFILWLDGFNTDGTPKLFVVSQLPTGGTS